MADASVKCFVNDKMAAGFGTFFYFFTGQEDLSGGNSAIISRLLWLIQNLKKGCLLESVDIVRYVQVCSVGFVGGKTEHQFWRETTPICNLGFTFSKFVFVYLPQK